MSAYKPVDKPNPAYNKKLGGESTSTKEGCETSVVTECATYFNSSGCVRAEDANEGGVARHRVRFRPRLPDFA